MAKEQIIISHWYQLVESFQYSPLAFYTAVEQAIQRRLVPQVETTRIDFKEGGLHTVNREYLRIVRGKHAFEICAAPFGSGFFFSWWFSKLPSTSGLLYLAAFMIALSMLVGIFFKAGWILGFFLTIFGTPFILWVVGNAIRQGVLDGEDAVLSIPLIGALYERLFQPITYYEIDTGLMFQQAVHNAVMEVIDQITEAKGIRALSETQRKPILKDFSSAA